MPETPPSDERPPRRRFQFGLGTMLLAAVPVSVLTAAWAGMVGLGAENPLFPRGFFIVLAAGAPMALMILLSACRSGLRLLRQFTRRR
jgi:hypothetical protein